MRRGVGVVATVCALVALPLGGAGGAARPPDLTGTWTPTTGGTWVLSASGAGLTHLHAEWAGVGAHAALHGTFDGTLNAAGTAYTGQFQVVEGSTQVSGAMTFTINNPNQLTVTLPGSTIVMTRSGGGTTTGQSPTATVASVQGEATVKHQDGKREALTSGTVLHKGDEVETAVDSRVQLRISDGAVMEVNEMTEILVGDVLNKGSRQAVNVALKLGELSAQVNPKKAYHSDFELKTSNFGTVPRGTVYSAFYDPGSGMGVVATRLGLVVVTPKAGRPVTVPAGKEVEVNATSTSPLAQPGKADAHGGIDRAAAYDVAVSAAAKEAKACGLAPPTTTAGFSTKPAAAGWLVTIPVVGNVKGLSVWTVAGSTATPANALAKQIAAGCQGAPPSVAGATVTFTHAGSPVGSAIPAPQTANDLEANMDPHTGAIANAYWTNGGHSLGAIAVPAGADGLVLATAPGAAPGTPVPRPAAATSFHVVWDQTGAITSASWDRVGKPLATIPVTAGQTAIAFTNGS